MDINLILIITHLVIGVIVFIDLLIEPTREYLTVGEVVVIILISFVPFVNILAFWFFFERTLCYLQSNLFNKVIWRRK